MSLRVVNIWCLLFVILFHFTYCDTHEGAIGSIEKNYRFKRLPAEPFIDGGGDEVEDPRKPMRYLCNESGCQCNFADWNQATEANCKCVTDGRNLPTSITISRLINLPPKLNILRISDCGSVKLDFFKTEVATFQSSFNEMQIQNSIFVNIRAGVLQNVANLIVKNVTMFSFDNNAFSNLVADNITFTDVTFNNDSASIEVFNPRNIKTRLEFINSNISSAMPIEINQINVTGVTVSFRNCHFYDGISERSKIAADHVEIIDNSFAELNPNQVQPMSVEFYQSLIVTGNVFSRFRMPDIRFNVKKMNAAGEMDIFFPNQKKDDSESAKSEAAVKWFKSLNFVFKGVAAEPRPIVNAHSCKDKWSWSTPPKYNIQCPNLDSMKQLVSAPRFKSFFANRPTSAVSAAAVNCICFSLFALIFAKLVSHFPLH